MLDAEKPKEANPFNAVYEQFCGRVFTYCQYRCGDTAAAEDLTAQVFERVLKALPGYDAQRAPLAAWIFAIARHVVTDWQRRQYLRVLLPFESFSRRASTDPGPEQRAVESEQRRELRKALEQLSAAERDLLGLRFASGLTNREIARLVNSGESKVAVTIFRALRKLRAGLQENESPAIRQPAKKEVKYE